VTIDAYLAVLGSKVPWLGRRRALAEAREHLRDSAARHRADGLQPDAAEEAAVDGFGDVEVVADRFAAEAAVLETRTATAVALLAVALFVFPLYVVPENTLPPAQWGDECNTATLGTALPSSSTITVMTDGCSWPSADAQPGGMIFAATLPVKPPDILVLQIVATVLWAVAGVFAAAGALLAWTRWSRFAAPALRVVPVALAGSIVASVVLVVRWFSESPMSAWWPVLGAPLAMVCLLACVGTAAWAHRRRRRLAQA
jgi:hypothetical protein